MKIGDTIYHVANPAVAGKILDFDGDCAVVRFESPVAFSGNPKRGFSDFWKCSTKLLHSSAEKALLADKKENR